MAVPLGLTAFDMSARHPAGMRSDIQTFSNENAHKLHLRELHKPYLP